MLMELYSPSAAGNQEGEARAADVIPPVGLAKALTLRILLELAPPPVT